MLIVSTDNWPLVIFEFSGEQSLEEHKRMLEEWQQLFTRQQKFIAVRIFHDDISVNHSREIGQLTWKWLNDGANKAIQERALAILNITPQASYAKMKNKNVERVFGVPGGIFKNTQDANQWLDNNIEKQFQIRINI